MIAQTTKDFLYDYAMRMVGLPYIWGGDDAVKGFDCSGFVVELLKSVGLLPHHGDWSSQAMFDMAPNRNFDSIIKSNFGDLLFFGKSAKEISHIAMALSDKLLIEAGGGDSTVVSPEVAEKKNAFIRIRPIGSRKDLIARSTPDYK